MGFDPMEGWEAKFCPGCGYAIPACKQTKDLHRCPLCQEEGKEIKLVDLYVVHQPENKVIWPLGLEAQQDEYYRLHQELTLEAGKEQEE